MSLGGAMTPAKKCYACKGVHTNHNEQIQCYRIHGLLIEANEMGKPVAKKAVVTDPERIVIVTCGWGNNTHKWETTKAEAIEHKACPEHR